MTENAARHDHNELPVSFDEALRFAWYSCVWWFCPRQQKDEYVQRVAALLKLSPAEYAIRAGLGEYGKPFKSWEAADRERVGYSVRNGLATLPNEQVVYARLHMYDIALKRDFLFGYILSVIYELAGISCNPLRWVTWLYNRTMVELFYSLSLRDISEHDTYGHSKKLARLHGQRSL